LNPQQNARASLVRAQVCSPPVATSRNTRSTTSMYAVSARPSVAATMAPLPAATAVTVPALVTASSAGAVVVHDTARSGSTAPVESRTVAVRVRLSPGTRTAESGATVTLATLAVGGAVDRNGASQATSASSAADRVSRWVSGICRQ